MLRSGWMASVFGRHSIRAVPAAYEVDDFQAVTVLQDGLRPAVTGDDVAVEFDGDAVGLHVEGFDQSGEGERGWRRGIWEGAGFAVDLQVHSR
jgi:hypothetical protein